MARKHTEDEVLKAISKKSDCRIKDKVIFVLNGKS